MSNAVRTSPAIPSKRLFLGVVRAVLIGRVSNNRVLDDIVINGSTEVVSKSSSEKTYRFGAELSYREFSTKPRFVFRYAGDCCSISYDDKDGLDTGEYSKQCLNDIGVSAVKNLPIDFRVQDGTISFSRRQ